MNRRNTSNFIMTFFYIIFYSNAFTLNFNLEHDNSIMQYKPKTPDKFLQHKTT